MEDETMKPDKGSLATPLHLLALFSIIEEKCTFRKEDDRPEFYMQVQRAITIELEEQVLPDRPNPYKEWNDLEEYFRHTVVDAMALETYPHVNFGDILTKADNTKLPEEDRLWYKADTKFQRLIKWEADSDEISESAPTVSHSEYYTSKDI
jgi:hypothetical protein